MATHTQPPSGRPESLTTQGGLLLLWHCCQIFPIPPKNGKEFVYKNPCYLEMVMFNLNLKYNEAYHGKSQIKYKFRSHSVFSPQVFNLCCRLYTRHQLEGMAVNL